MKIGKVKELLRRSAGLETSVEKTKVTSARVKPEKRACCSSQESTRAGLDIPIGSFSSNLPPPLNFEFTDEEFSILNGSNEILLKTASFAFAKATDGSTRNTELSFSRTTASDQAVHVMAPLAECVTER
ncbi:hypothetical protein DD237_004921 [Peronospora effusa]|uniref:Uncharacterized protein n=1 Tax=Peronospora effusa TaxID=542832 RepID=A0A425C4Y8_9STRA|nr:hypothetical protein DD237_004921 [Peronospora effusa]